MRKNYKIVIVIELIFLLIAGILIIYPNQVARWFHTGLIISGESEYSIHEHDTNIRHTFYLFNFSPFSIHITSATPTCHCSSVALDTAKISPFHGSRVSVNVNTARFSPGEYRKGIILSLNNNTQRESILFTIKVTS